MNQLKDTSPQLFGVIRELLIGELSQGRRVHLEVLAYFQLTLDEKKLSLLGHRKSSIYVPVKGNYRG